MSASLPNPPTEYAAEGSVAHTLAEELVTGKIDQVALASRVGEVVEQEGYQITVTEEMVAACVLYNDLIDADFAEFHTSAPKGKGGVEVHQAAEIKVQAVSVDSELWGTADYLIYQKGRKLNVYDFKFGKGYSVSAEKNKQMGIYAIAAMDTIAGSAYDEVELIIVQPRTADPIRRWVAPKEWLEGLRVALKAAVEDTRDPLAKVAAGDWCRWCAAKATCPELYKKAQEQAAVDFAAVLPPVKGELVGLPHVSELPIEKLVLALGWEDAFEAWFKALRTRATDMLSAGLDVPGYKLVEGRSNRRYKDEQQIIAIFEPVVGERLWEKKILSPAKLEAVVGKGKLAEYTEKPEGRKTLARETDTRQAVRSSAAADFGPVDAGVAKALELDKPKPCEACAGADVFGPCAVHAPAETVPANPMWPQ